MNAFKSGLHHHFYFGVRRAAALLSMLALLSGTFVSGGAATASAVQQKGGLSEEQRIVHVLNRLGYGARPGDVERVRALGLENYIRQQLEPEKITDAVADAKVRDLTTLQLSTAELYAKYPQPGQLLRQLQRRGELPPELSALRDDRVKGAGAASSAPTAKPDGAEEAAMMAGPAGATRPNAAAVQPEDKQEYRRAIRDYMLKNGMQPPQRIVAELQASRILRAVYSERQLQEVVVAFRTNPFNVFAGKGADRWLLVSYDRDTIPPHTLGKFQDLLVATAQSPAMLFYLDNFQSASPNAARRPGAGLGPRPQGGLRGLFPDQMMRGGRADARPGAPAQNPAQRPAQQQQTAPQQQQRQRRGINENYARELMELHTLGVDGGYTQKDVQEVARCFTGWTIIAPRGAGAAAQAIMNPRVAEMVRNNPGTFVFRPGVHDNGEKIVLGHKIPAGGGMKDGLMVLDILAHHPSTAKFIATKLVRHFVSDNPPPALVERVAATFMKSDGDIHETLKTIFFSKEFNSPEAYRAKIKRPFELAISAVRTLDADTNCGTQN